MPISSYVVRFPPGGLNRVCVALRAVPGLELGEASENGVAVVADTATSGEAEEMGERLQNLPGVSSAVLVYHNFEDVTNPGPAPASHRRSNSFHDP